jgi:hypothetical protein
LQRKSKPTTYRKPTRSQTERTALPELRQALGAIGIQLSAARSGVGKLSLGDDRYFVEAFGDAYVLSNSNGYLRTFWDLQSAVAWVRAERRKAVGKLPPIHAPRQANCG